VGTTFGEERQWSTDAAWLIEPAASSSLRDVTDTDVPASS